MIKHHFRTGLCEKQTRGNKLLIWEHNGWSKLLLAAEIVSVMLGGETFNCTLIPAIMNGFILAPVICGTLVITAVSVWYMIFISSVPFLTLSCALKSSLYVITITSRSLFVNGLKLKQTLFLEFHIFYTFRSPRLFSSSKYYALFGSNMISQVFCSLFPFRQWNLILQWWNLVLYKFSDLQRFQ